MQLYERFGRDWEQATFTAVLRLLGMPKNTETFEALAKNLPLRILQKHNRPPQTEALLLGMAGLLPEETETPYALQLKREFSFLQEKFNLQGELNKVGSLAAYALRLSRSFGSYVWRLGCVFGHNGTGNS